MPLWLRDVGDAGERIANVFQPALPMENIADQLSGTARSLHIRMYSQLAFVLTTKSCRNQNGGLVFLVLQSTETVRVTQIPIPHTVLRSLTPS
jgi:hypothetical protein